MTAPGQGTLVDFGGMQTMSVAFDQQADQMTAQNQAVTVMNENVRVAYTSQAQQIFSAAVDSWQANFTTVIASCRVMSQNLAQAGRDYTAADDESQAGAQSVLGSVSDVQLALG
ncbi:MAG TPA: WXG100 family type VII secretion target [Pseudonocardia sp.]|nr:WXG100 family type VII secretion target [Pseudonocardia sp.]